MNKTNDYSKGVMAITNMAKEVNPKIGSYREHFLIENFGFIVRLSNGGIKIPTEVAKNYETHPASLTKEIIQAVAESYWTT
jgi:hypothetical protein